MIDHDIDPQFEQELRSLLTEIADRFDPHAPQPLATSDTARRLRIGAAAALVVAGVAGIALVAARTTGDEPGNATVPTSASIATNANGQIAERLLYPGRVDPGSSPEVSVVELSGADIAVLESPTGQLHRVSVVRVGATELDSNADRRVINGRTVVAEQADSTTAYQWIDQCVLGSLQGANAQPAWNDDDLALLSAVEIDADQATLVLPQGWSTVNTGRAAPLIQLIFDVTVDGTTRTVVLGQSVGGSITAVPPGGFQSFTPTDAVPGRTAWVTQDGRPSPALVFDNDGVAVGLWGQDLTVEELGAIAADLVTRPAEWSRLLTDPIESVPTGTPAPGGPPELCGPPTLTITS